MLKKKIRRRKILILIIWLFFIVFIINASYSVSIRSTVQSEKKSMRSVLSEAKDSLPDIIGNEAKLRERYARAFGKRSSILPLLVDMGAEDAVLDEAALKHYTKILGGSAATIVDSEGHIVSNYRSKQKKYSKKVMEDIKEGIENNDEEDVTKDTYKDVILTEPDLKSLYVDLVMAEKMDEDHYFIMETEAEGVYELLDETVSWKNAISDISLEGDGFLFAVAEDGKTIMSHPDESFIGKDVTDLGYKSAEDFKKIYQKELDITKRKLNGSQMLTAACRVDGLYVVAVSYIPEKNIKSIFAATGTTAAVFFFISFIVVCYLYFCLDSMSMEGKNEASASVIDELRDGSFQRKLLIFAIIVLMITALGGGYIQLISNFSKTSISSNQVSRQMIGDQKRTDRQQKKLEKWFENESMDRCQITASILKDHRSLWNRKSIKKIAKTFEIPYIYILGQNGKMIVTNSNFDHMSVSKKDKSPFSKSFYPLLRGRNEVRGETDKDENTGKEIRYLGVSLRNKDDLCDGCMGIAVQPFDKVGMSKEVILEKEAQWASSETDSYTIMVDAKTKKIKIHPKDKWIGKKASEIGLTKDILKINYNRTVTLEGKSSFISVDEIDGNYIIGVSPVVLFTDDLIYPVMILLASMLCCLTAFFFCIVADGLSELVIEAADKAKMEGPHETEIAAKENSRSLISRLIGSTIEQKKPYFKYQWDYSTIPWRQRHPYERIKTIMVLLVIYIAARITTFYMAGIHNDSGDSILNYIICGDWERGVNLYSITAAVLISVVGLAITIIAHMLLFGVAWFASVRGETICHLLDSTVSYVVVIMLLYYILYMFGVDTRTLVASAGILGLILGMGANELIKDMLSGVFLIFEGVLRSGDYVSLSETTSGTIAGVGLRMTKIDTDGTIISISNSKITNVINMSKPAGRVRIELAIDIREPIGHVEEIIERELPEISKHISGLTEDICYCGVSNIGETGVLYRFDAWCISFKATPIRLELNRQLLAMVERNDLCISYPHLVVHENENS